MKKIFLFALVATASAAFGLEPRPINDVLKSAGLRDKVVISGQAVRFFDFDTILISDGNDWIAVSFAGLKHAIHLHDRVVIAGRFRGRAVYLMRYGLLDAFDWAPASDPRANDLITQFGVAISSPVVAGPSLTPAPSANVESRLRTLDDLKKKNLITDEEYRDQRKRILNEL